MPNWTAMHNDFPYDLESYPNVFSAVIVHATSDCTLICACTTTEEREACTRACDAVVL